MHDFDAELRQYGPLAVRRIWTVERARCYCARLARSHYENFTVVSALLPRRLVPHFYPVYAFCRWADDLGDETGGGVRALELLHWWRDELALCYDAVPRHPVMIALQPTIEKFHIPRQLFLDLIAAFEQDQRISRYESFDQLLDYCRFSANPVGRLVLHLCGCFTPENAELSDHICTGLQLANFWQDIRRDLDQLNRVYLPDEDRCRFGYKDADLEARRFTPEFARLLQFEVERTRQLFTRGEPLLARLPHDVRVDIDLFLRGGRSILDRIESAKFDVLTRRPVVTKFAKMVLLGRAVASRIWLGLSQQAPPRVRC